VHEGNLKHAPPNMSLHIVIDARRIRDFGIGTYIRSLLYALSYLMLGLVGSYSLALAAMAVNTLGEMTIAPTTLAVVGELAPVVLLP
jgi:hypothetical protein